jgi:hypothetical protein
MPTSVHIPKPLLVAVDRRARQLKMSRNGLIVRALENEIVNATSWSPDFFEQLSKTEPGDEVAVDEMLRAIRAGRTSKKASRL